MNNLNHHSTYHSGLPLIRHLLILSLLLTSFLKVTAQTETLSTGSYIIDMDSKKPQVLRSYGMVYDLLKNYKVPIKWVIDPNKTKDDDTDFEHNGVKYRSGPFIIPAEFRTAAVNSRISFWQGRGVIGATTVAPVDVPVHTTLYFVPRWTLDKKNGDIATTFFSLAEIPSSAYGGSSSNWVEPKNLDCCTDLFVMPHADPAWKSHGRLYSWNLECKGGIWLGCHSGSALENMVNPSNSSQQTNFLAQKTGTPGNALIPSKSHKDASSYDKDYAAEPVMQFRGKTQKAHQSGAEQVYVPLSPGWRPTTKVGAFDPQQQNRISNNIEHRAALIAWGPGLGDPNRGQVMLCAGHDIADQTNPDFISAIRAFFNFSFYAIENKVIIPTIAGMNPTVALGTSNALSISLPPGENISNYSINWSSSCGGTFSPNSTSASVTYTAPSAPTSECTITMLITDACGRESFATQTFDVQCNLNLTSTVTEVCGNDPNSGAINFTPSNGQAPYSYSWVRNEGGSGSGSGTSIAGLATGTYSVTVTSANGCAANLRVTVNASPAINISPIVTNITCFGATNGAINLNVSGGTPPFSYNWGGGVTSQNRSELPTGTYAVTVTDAKGCTATQAGITVTQPTSALTATPTATNIACFGGNDGAISLSVSGGTAPYSYLWGDATTTKDRTSLTAGTYSVTISDANGCTLSSGATLTQPAGALSVSLAPTPSLCSGSGNSSITATVAGGTAPYTYDWSGSPVGDGTPTISSLAAGSYSLTVTDANGCTTVAGLTIVSPPPLALSLTKTNPTCPPGSTIGSATDGSIDLTVSGGTAPYTYDWTTADGSGIAPADEDQTNLAVGTYNVTVTDANGCSASISTTLTAVNPAPVPASEIIHN